MSASILSRETIEEKAQAILKRHGLETLPIDPVKLANQEGITVSNATFTHELISGMIGKREGVTTMLVKQADIPQRKRFTIAHELGHYFLHLAQSGEYMDTEINLFREETRRAAAEGELDEKEVQANQFAAALLMPAQDVAYLYSKINDATQLAQLFNVSKAAMAKRLKQLELTDDKA